MVERAPGAGAGCDRCPRGGEGRMQKELGGELERGGRAVKPILQPPLPHLPLQQPGTGHCWD